MRISNQKGSAALVGCVTAFSGLVKVLCSYGSAPVAAVLLGLIAVAVIHKMTTA